VENKWKKTEVFRLAPYPEKKFILFFTYYSKAGWRQHHKTSEAEFLVVFDPSLNEL
jgi:hypothetical protein